MGVGEVKEVLSFDPLTLGCPAWNRVGLRQGGGQDGKWKGERLKGPGSGYRSEAAHLRFLCGNLRGFAHHLMHRTSISASLRIEL